MGFIEKSLQYVKHPLRLYSFVSRMGWTRFVSDETHLKIMYRALIGKKANFDDPKGFNEKLNWLKLHDRNPLYNILVDKLAVKQWVADKIGAQYVSKTYSSWDGVENISRTIRA